MVEKAPSSQASNIEESLEALLRRASAGSGADVGEMLRRLRTDRFDLESLRLLAQDEDYYPVLKLSGIPLRVARDLKSALLTPYASTDDLA